jgi:hypothetical protein
MKKQIKLLKIWQDKVTSISFKFNKLEDKFKIKEEGHLQMKKI